jgi:hypothetical protein
MPKLKRPLALAASGITIASLMVGATFALHGTSHAAAYTQSTLQNLTTVGTAEFPTSGSTQQFGNSRSDQVSPDTGTDQKTTHATSTQPNAPTTVPAPSGNAVTPGNSTGFNGLTHADQRNAGTGAYTNTQFSLEPPDQALCVGGGYLIESVNTALAVYNTSGARLTSVAAINQFLGLAPEINRTTLTYGDFTSDPKCYYDPGTGHWFLTVLQMAVNPTTGAFAAPSHTFIAVSQTTNPTGAWSVFKFDTTDDGSNGTPSHPNCPCFGDQPLIGANADGFYVTTNEFPMFANGFNGAQVYAISKSRLVAAAEAGSSTLPKVVHFDAGDTAIFPTPDAGAQWYSIQPATSPAGNAVGQGQTKNAEFFMSALQFGPAPLDNRIAVWSLSNTSALASGNPQALSLTNTVISSVTYGQPPNAAQKAGPTLLGTLLGASEEQLQSNDDRMNQVVYADGLLYSGVNTVVQSSDGTQNVGIAYFIVNPSIRGRQVSASMVKDGYVSVDKENVMYPSIGVNARGQGAMTFTLVGPGYYPSAAYTLIDATHGAGDVHISAAGAAPDDGFTGYAVYGGSGAGRWGDYSAAVADADGSIWMAVEYIPDAPRTILANWGTYITHVSF